MERVYACIDLKSFYASVECAERGMDPLNANLVVADSERTDKTICLAVSPTLKQYGLSGRSRLYEVVAKIKEVNNERRKNNNYKPFRDKSYLDSIIKSDKEIEVTYIVSKPRMKLYMDYSNKIYNIYLKFLSSEDIIVYSIDEIFCDLTSYLSLYKLSKEELVTKMIKEVYDETGITATAGIGTNLYLAKIAMDITAKHMMPNDFGVRLAYLDEELYKKTLWSHKPLTDFWRVGKGISKRLNDNHMYTMGDIARMSLTNEDKLFKLFGVNAELLIDHAWGIEPCTIKDIKSYKPKINSISRGQVLSVPYDSKKAKLIVREMTDLLVLDLVKKNLITNKISLYIGYDVDNLKGEYKYDGEIIKDHYGRSVPKYSEGNSNLDFYTSSTKVIMDNMMSLYDRIIKSKLLIRRITIAFNDIIPYSDNYLKINKQLDLFSNNETCDSKDLKDERNMQKAIIKIQEKYGKNSILKGMNYEEGATTIERNKTVGGHRG